MSGNGTSAPILQQSDGHATPSSCLTPQISAFNWFSILLLDPSWSYRSKIYTRGKLVATFNQRLRLRHQRAVIATFQLQYWPGPQLGASSSTFGWLCGLEGNKIYTFHPKYQYSIESHFCKCHLKKITSSIVKLKKTKFKSLLFLWDKIQRSSTEIYFVSLKF